MYVRRILRAFLLGVVLCGGSVFGVPMRPEEIDDLMSCMNKPHVEVTIDEEKMADDLTRHILGQMDDLS